MRATITVAGILALALGAGALLAALTGEVHLAVAATAALVLLAAGAGAIVLLRMHRAQRSLARTVLTVSERLTALDRDLGRQARMSKRVDQRLAALSSDVRGVTREVQRAGTQTRELLEVQEVRLAAQVDEAEESGRQRLAAGVALAAADAAAAAQLVALYRPGAPVGLSGPSPGRLLPLLLAAVDAAPRRVLTVDLGEQVLWLAGALPAAEIVTVLPADQEGALRRAVARHGLTDRVYLHPTRRRRPDLAHYYDDWYDPDGLVAGFDLLLLGRGTQAAFPAVPLLAPLLGEGGLVLLVEDEGSPVRAWREAGLVEVDEALSAPPVLALRPAPRSAG